MASANNPIVIDDSDSDDGKEPTFYTLTLDDSPPPPSTKKALRPEAGNLYPKPKSNPGSRLSPSPATPVKSGAIDLLSPQSGKSSRPIKFSPGSPNLIKDRKLSLRGVSPSTLRSRMPKPFRAEPENVRRSGSAKSASPPRRADSGAQDNHPPEVGGPSVVSQNPEDGDTQNSTIRSPSKPQSAGLGTNPASQLLSQTPKKQDPSRSQTSSSSSLLHFSGQDVDESNPSDHDSGGDDASTGSTPGSPMRTRSIRNRSAKPSDKGPTLGQQAQRHASEVRQDSQGSITIESITASLRPFYDTLKSEVALEARLLLADAKQITTGNTLTKFVDKTSPWCSVREPQLEGFIPVGITKVKIDPIVSTTWIGKQYLLISTHSLSLSPTATSRNHLHQ